MWSLVSALNSTAGFHHREFLQIIPGLALAVFVPNNSILKLYTKNLCRSIKNIFEMKKIICLSILFISVANTFAQKEVFDIVNYTPPNNWKKDVTENNTSYTFVNKKNNSWCRINIVKSTTSKGSIEQDFESEWQELVVKSYQPTEAPQLNEVQEADGWEIKAGSAKFTFNNSDAMAMLTTMSGFNRCVSIVATTNSQEYLKDIETFLSSVDLQKPETVSTQTTVNNNDNNSVLGIWLANASDQSSWRVSNGVMNYICRQYTFNANGAYSFISKAFDPLMDKILLGKENGTFQISGNSITVNPQKSVLEGWSKKEGKDEWGKLLNTQNITLERITYQFTKHYFSGIKEWSLVLQADKVTQRDGPFSGGTAFSNAWIYGTPCNTCLIKLPE